ncbi:MAG: hypothetical protein V1757_01675 [Actinomycetota bacterium]
MRRWVIGPLILSAVAAGCGGETGATYSEEAVQEWLGICMEGPPFEAYCRCQADAAAPFADEALFLEHIRSPLFLLPDEAIDEQRRRCDHLEPTLRADGVAGVAFGTSLEPALAELVEIFGEAEIADVPDCAATVAAWEGLRLTFSSTDSLVGWAYGAFQVGDDTDPLGLHAEIHSQGGTWWVYTANTPWSSYSDLVSDPVFVADDPPMLVLTGADGPGESLRAFTAGTDPGDSIIRLEAGTVCPLGP